MNPIQVPDPAITPGTGEGDMYFFQGGTISSLFNGGTLEWEDDPNLPGDNMVVPKYNNPDDPTSGQVVIGDEKHPAPFPALFDYFRFRDDDDLDDYPNGLSFDTDGDGADDLTVTDPDAVWTATVPIYEDSEPCINPNEALKIVGFAIVRVIMPNPPPDSTVTVRIDCYLTFIGGHGGGGTSGTLRASIPNLVE